MTHRVLQSLNPGIEGMGWDKYGSMMASCALMILWIYVPGFNLLRSILTALLIYALRVGLKYYKQELLGEIKGFQLRKYYDGCKPHEDHS